MKGFQLLEKSPAFVKASSFTEALKDNFGDKKKSNKKEPKELSAYFLLLPFFLFLLFLTLSFYNNKIETRILKNSIRFLPFPITASSQYPILKKSINEGLLSSSLTAEAAIIIDNDSKTIIYSKNPTLRFSMASTTKIMTALVSLQSYKMDQVLTIKSDFVEGAVVGFKKGERVRFEDLLYAMLLPSGNDAALAIAQNYPGEESMFIEKMNENAKFFKLFSMHFSDSSGLNDQGDYTTASDLARLASIAIKNKTFADVVSSKQKTITNVDGKKSYSLYNLNRLLGTNGINGIKTGFTDEAQGVLVTSKKENGKTFIIVVMRSKDRFLDTQKLLSVINNNITYLKFDPKSNFPL